MSMPAHSRLLSGTTVAAAVRRLIRFLRRCEAGQALIEYAIMAALIAVSLVVVLSALRNAVGGVMNGTASAVSSQASGGYGPPGGSPSLHVGPVPPATPDPGDSSVTDNDSSGVGQ